MRFLWFLAFPALCEFFMHANITLEGIPQRWCCRVQLSLHKLNHIAETMHIDEVKNQRLYLASPEKSPISTFPLNFKLNNIFTSLYL